MVICLGELVVDFISTERVTDIGQATTFYRRIGGSPANVAIGLHAMGVPVRLVSKTGKDVFGNFVRSALQRSGVSDADVVNDDNQPTRCVFIAYDHVGRRKIAIANRRSADQFLKREDLNAALLDNSRLLHLSGPALLSETTSSTALWLVKKAKKKGLKISFDLNMPLITPSPFLLRGIKTLLPLVDILKINALESSVLHERNLLDDSIEAIQICTLGPEGARIKKDDREVVIPAVETVLVDQTGAGDGFIAGFLAAMVDNPRMTDPSDAQLLKWARKGSECAGRVIRHIGASEAYL